MEALTSWDLKKTLGLDPNRVRRKLKKLAKYHGEDPKKYLTKNQFHKPAIIIPENRLLELLEEMVIYQTSVPATVENLTRLKNRSILKRNNWGVVVLEDKRGQKTPALWKVENSRIKAGFLKVTTLDIQLIFQ